MFTVRLLVFPVDQQWAAGGLESVNLCELAGLPPTAKVMRSSSVSYILDATVSVAFAKRYPQQFARTERSQVTLQSAEDLAWLYSRLRSRELRPYRNTEYYLSLVRERITLLWERRQDRFFDLREYAHDQRRLTRLANQAAAPKRRRARPRPAVAEAEPVDRNVRPLIIDEAGGLPY